MIHRFYVFCSTLLVSFNLAALDLDRAPKLIDDEVGVMDRALAQLAVQPLWQEAADAAGYRVRDGLVQVVVDAAESEQLTAWLEAHGARHVLASRSGRVQAWLGLEQLRQLELVEGVQWIGRPVYISQPEPRGEMAFAKTGDVLSEGLAAMNAGPWHDAGYTGLGVKVGIIDGGFEDYETYLGTELPPTERVVFKSFGGSSNAGSGNHGTGCAEIVSDVAPDASLYLALTSTNIDVEKAIEWLEDNGVAVVTMSVGFATLSPGDGTGSLHDLIRESVVSYDMVWATSAGNSRQGHWQGRTVDVDGDGWVEFAEGEEINRYVRSVSAGSRLSTAIVWNDWEVADQDYSLHLFRIAEDGSTEEVAVSDRPQGGSSRHRPTEQLSYTVAEDGSFGIGVYRKNVTETHDLQAFEMERNFELAVEQGSLTIPADSADLLAVAAAGPGAPYTYRSYSSAGPTNGPGGSIDGGYLKPDITGYDGVSSVTMGRFYGTSAASPHVGGAAALVRGAHPEWDADEVKAFLLGNAIDKGPGGPDTDYGYGRLNLGLPPGSACSFSLAPTSADHPAQQSGGLIVVSADEGCFWSASSRAAWITVSPDSNVGNGYVAYSVATNESAASRVGVIEVAGLEFSVTQAGLGCTYALDPASLSFDAGGGDAEVEVVTGAGCTWQASSSSSWLEISGGASGVGPGSLAIHVPANTDATARSATLQVADQQLSVSQAGAATAELRQVVGGIADIEGAAGTHWVSSLAVLNLDAASAELTLRYHGNEGMRERMVEVAGSGIVEWTNVAADLFGLAAPTSGSVEVISERPVVATARTFNAGAEGSYGQYLPGVSAEDTIPAGAVAVLAPLASNAGFRTNIGLVNPSQEPAVGSLQLYDGSGQALGTPLVVNVEAAGWGQLNRVFEISGAGECDACYAAVTADEDVWFYASVVDYGSGDPTTLPAVVPPTPGVGRRYVVAGMADVSGTNDTRWKSTLSLVNPGTDTAHVQLALVEDGRLTERSELLSSGELTSWPNVVDDLFARPGGVGAVEVVSDGAVVIAARTYNEGPEGTFGQFLPAVTRAETLNTGRSAVLPQIKRTEDFRTNIGVVSFSELPCSASIELYGAGGEALGNTLYLDVQPGAWAQKNEVFDTAGVQECSVGYARLTVLSAGCELWAYASVVDNLSGDPTTVPMAALN